MLKNNNNNNDASPKEYIEACNIGNDSINFKPISNMVIGQ